MKSSIRNKASQLNLTKKVKYYFWTDEEVDYLKNNYGSLSLIDLEKNLNHSIGSIKEKAGILNLQKSHFFWNEKENKYLKDNYLILSIEELAKNLNRSKGSILHEVGKLNLNKKRDRYLKWTEWKIEYLKDNYDHLNLKELRNILNRSEHSIYQKAFELNLYRDNFFWTEEEIKYLKNNYECSDINLLNLNNHSWKAIKVKASFLGLKRNSSRENNSNWKGGISFFSLLLKI